MCIATANICFGPKADIWSIMIVQDTKLRRVANADTSWLPCSIWNRFGYTNVRGYAIAVAPLSEVAGKEALVR
jgi:hypothetical protein